MPLVRSLARPLVRSLVHSLTGIGSTDLETLQKLFANDEAGALYAPWETSSLYEDSAGTTLASVDGPVGRMEDLSGNGNHATQSTEVARPVLRSAGGLYWLEFDGVDDLLVFDGSFISGTVGRSVLFAGRGSASTSIGIWNFGTATVAKDAWILTSEVAIRISGGNEVYSDAVTSADGVVSHLYPSGGAVENSDCWVNGAVSAQSTVVASAVATVANASSELFGQVSGTGVISGRFYGGLAIPREITATERQSAERALANRSGVVLA